MIVLSMSKATFGAFEFDPERRTLKRGSDSVELAARRMAILQYLVDHRERPVSKKELREKVLPDVHIEDNSIDKLVSSLRRALGEPPGGGKYIHTIYGSGWQFVADVTHSAEPAAPPPAVEKSAPRANRPLNIGLIGLLLVVLVGAVAIQVYGVAIAAFLLVAAIVVTGRQRIQNSVFRRVAVSVFFLAAMAYIPSVATETEAMENAINQCGNS
jgi:DNA-binding winged helix-turn-helix (wHTH) protein